MKRPGLKSWTVIGIGVLVTGFALSQSSNLGGPAYLAGVVQLIAGSGVSLSPTNGLGTVTVSATGSGGSVTSVGLADGSTAPFYTIANSPVTGAGTLTFTLVTQAANCVLAGPTSGAAAQPTCRSLVTADLPTIPSTQISGLGTFATANTTTAPAITMGTGNAITPSSGGGIVGVTSNNAAAAGTYGELQFINCNANSSQTVTIAYSTGTIPAAIVWTTAIQWVVSPTNPAAWTCGVVFTTSGSLPTGISTATTYWVVGALVSGTTFYLTDTAAHALACASTSCTGIVNITAAGSGTQTATMGPILTTATWTAGAAMNLQAGDWDCYSLWQGTGASLTASIGYKSAVYTSVGLPANNLYSTVSYASTSTGNPFEALLSPPTQELLSSTTTIYGIGQITFGGGSATGGAYLRCRRMH